jgi:hypothetical protein
MSLDDGCGSEVGMNQFGFTQIRYGILFRIRLGVSSGFATTMLVARD